MSYTIVWCEQPNSNEHWVMECGIKGIYPTRKAAMDAIRRKLDEELDYHVKTFKDDYAPEDSEDDIRRMAVHDWMVNKAGNSLSWYQYGEPYPVLYKVVKIPTEKKK